MKVSIIVPVYNEERTILTTLIEIKRNEISGVNFQVIVVDDGSTDSTKALLMENQHLHDIFIALARNGGKGAAVIAALEKADGDYVLFQDADLEYNPSEYGKLLFPIKNFNADVVIGSRTLAPQYTRVVYFWHMVGNKWLSLFFNILNNTTFTDIYSCYLCYRRDLVEPSLIKSLGWEQHAEILCETLKRARILYEVPIAYHGRSYAEGKKIRGYHIFSIVSMIARKKFFG